MPIWPLHRCRKTIHLTKSNTHSGQKHGDRNREESSAFWWRVFAQNPTASTMLHGVKTEWLPPVIRNPFLSISFLHFPGSIQCSGGEKKSPSFILRWWDLVCGKSWWIQTKNSVTDKQVQQSLCWIFCTKSMLFLYIPHNPKINIKAALTRALK